MAQRGDDGSLGPRTWDRGGQRTARTTGSVQSRELEIRQLVLPALVRLIVMQGHGLVLMRETLEHADVYEVIVTNLNLQKQSGVRGRGRAPTQVPRAPGLCEDGPGAGEPRPRRAPAPGGRRSRLPPSSTAPRPAPSAPLVHSAAVLGCPKSSVLTSMQAGACAHTLGAATGPPAPSVSVPAPAGPTTPRQARPSREGHTPP